MSPKSDEVVVTAESLARLLRDFIESGGMRWVALDAFGQLAPTVPEEFGEWAMHKLYDPKERRAV